MIFRQLRVGRRIAFIAAVCSLFIDGAVFACERPIRVNSLNEIGRSSLALRNVYGPAAVGSDCTIIDRHLFGSTIDFFILPQSVSDTSSVYVYIKSYRLLTSRPLDKIKMSRGASWFFADKAGVMNPLERRDDVPFTGSVDKWNNVHANAATPEEMEEQLKYRWHAYVDSAKSGSSNQRAGFWRSREGFDFARGTLTNILIRFPSEGRTPAKFQIGVPKATTEFELEISSNADGLSGFYRFVMR